MIDNIISTNYNEIGNDKVLLDISTLKQLQIITHFKQLRFECYKKSHGRRIDIVTNDNADGLAVLDYFVFENISEPLACNTFKRLPSDNSYTTSRCASWSYGKWGHTLNPSSRQLYATTFFIPGTSHFMLASNKFGVRWECDDYSNSEGEWKFYFK